MFPWMTTLVLRGMIELFDHQLTAVDQLKTGSILQGGVGSGKSLTAIAYYHKNEHPKDLFVITTAKKRDSLDWEREWKQYGLYSTDFLDPFLKVDSWNNLKKYVKVENCFFIFDEQRLVGSGVWVRSFLKIVKSNNWILLSATPGDTWMDYIPVFVANGFYKNRTEFIRRHVIYNSFVKFPKVDRYVEVGRLERLKKEILVVMEYQKETVSIYKNLSATFDKDKYTLVFNRKWNPYTDKPIQSLGELFFTIRKVVNSDPSRFALIETLLDIHRKLIVFYNFNYELDILKELSRFPIKVAEYNGHKHEPLPEGDKWVYLVQYMSGGEGWNCIETNTIVFYSLNYSYRIMTQAAGRIDRLNTPFAKLFYYRIISDSPIDKAILKALGNKKTFNQKNFIRVKNMCYNEGE